MGAGERPSLLLAIADDDTGVLPLTVLKFK